MQTIKDITNEILATLKELKGKTVTQVIEQFLETFGMSDDHSRSYYHIISERKQYETHILLSMCASCIAFQIEERLGNELFDHLYGGFLPSYGFVFEKDAQGQRLHDMNCLNSMLQSFDYKKDVVEDIIRLFERMAFRKAA